MTLNELIDVLKLSQERRGTYRLVVPINKTTIPLKNVVVALGPDPTSTLVLELDTGTSPATGQTNGQ